MVRKFEGFILYVYLLVDFFKENVFFFDLGLFDSFLFFGILIVYYIYFKCLENEFCKELSIKEEEFLMFLSVLVVVRELLLLSFVVELMFLGIVFLVDSWRLSKVILFILVLLFIWNGCIYFFYKLVRDWLIDKVIYGKYDFFVEEKEGYCIFFRVCVEDVDEVKCKGVDG